MKVLKIQCKQFEPETIYVQDTSASLSMVLEHILGSDDEWQDIDNLRIEITTAEMSQSEFEALDFDWAL